jgi:hypothetical protein
LRRRHTAYWVSQWHVTVSVLREWPSLILFLSLDLIRSRIGHQGKITTALKIKVMDGRGRRKDRYAYNTRHAGHVGRQESSTLRVECHQNDSQLPLRTKEGMGKEGKRTALIGTGNRNRGISGKWCRNLNSLLHLQAGKDGIRKSPIEFVLVLEKAKGILKRRPRI